VSNVYKGQGRDIEVRIWCLLMSRWGVYDGQNFIDRVGFGGFDHRGIDHRGINPIGH